MMVEPNFEINVSKDGKHFCHVELRHIIILEFAQERARIIKAKFPEIEGWKVTMTRVECHGQEVEIK